MSSVSATLPRNHSGFECISDPMDKRDATIPEIIAPLTFEAYRHKIDPALEVVTGYKEGGESK
jgi:hypothetical protein